MKIKTMYICPELETVEVKSYGLLDSLSMGVSDDPAFGGGDAKGTSIFDGPEDESGVTDFSDWND